VKSGYMDLPRKPGFGMELKAGVAAKFPFVPGSYWRRNPRYPAA
jgi:L-alanine-DL-glutamate epimerase-like enolase superfamily enzyme